MLDILSNILAGVISGIIVSAIGVIVVYLFNNKLKKYWDEIIHYKDLDDKIRVGSQVQTNIEHFLKGIGHLSPNANVPLMNGTVVKIEKQHTGQKFRVLHVKPNKDRNFSIEYSDKSVVRMDDMVALIPENQVVKIYPRRA